MRCAVGSGREKKGRFGFKTGLKLLAEDPVQRFGMMDEELVRKFVQKFASSSVDF